MSTVTESALERFRIDDTDVILEDFGDGKGKIIIASLDYHNYSYYWGAMGSNLREFLCHTSADYFVTKLMGPREEKEMDVKATFKALRKCIREEMRWELPWYKHMEFQKEMREVMRDFQSSCEEFPSEQFFVNSFDSSFVNRLDFYLIEDKRAEGEIKDYFKYIECWHFIEKKPNRESLWLKSFHAKLKRHLTIN
jgi:hypothetical protein